MNDRLHQRIISASRTKAIVHGIANLDDNEKINNEINNNDNNEMNSNVVIGIESRNDAAFEAAAAVSDRATVAVSRNILRELDSRKRTPPPVPRKL